MRATIMLVAVLVVHAYARAHGSDFDTLVGAGESIFFGALAAILGAADGYELYKKR